MNCNFQLGTLIWRPVLAKPLLTLTLKSICEASSLISCFVFSDSSVTGLSTLLILPHSEHL